MLVVSVLCLMGCADDPDVNPLKRDTDAVEVAYNTDATTQFTVRFNGPWTASVVCGSGEETDIDKWFSITPDNGVGNGRDYQYVTVTAQRNAGVARTGYVYIQPKNSNAQPLKISVKQADGIFSVAEPKIGGILRSGSPSAGELVIEYDKAFGGEKIVVKSSLSGDAADGLAIREEYETEIPEEGSGTISVPITGTPAFLGTLICSVEVLLDGEQVFSGNVKGNVVSNNEIFRMGFDKFVWGGKYIENKPGPGPNGNKGADKTFMGNEPAEEDKITAGSDGTSDVFLTMTETYRINRGVEKWDGSKIYEHPGYLKMGTGTASGWILTPELEGLSSAPETVVLSIDFCRFQNEAGTYYVTAEGAGVVTNGTINSTVLPAPTNASERKWTTLTFTVEGATNKTRIKLAAEDFAAGNNRLNIDNFVVMGAAKAEVKEPLPAPEADKIIYIPKQNAITLSWEGVKGATSYEVAIAQKERPDFKNTLNTEETVCEFTDLEPGLYILMMKALYADNPEFNSEETSKAVGTAGYADVKLETPADLAYSDLTPNNAKLSWSFVSGAAGYRVVVGTAEDPKPVVSVVLPANGFGSQEYTAEKLKSGTNYTVNVLALVGDGSAENELDSDAAQMVFTTPEPIVLSKPALKLYHTSYCIGVVQFGFDAGEQKDTKFNIQLLNAEDGSVLREYSGWSFAAKYTKHGTRFLFGGLESGKSYKAKIQRIAIDKNAWVDSEWSDELTFATDPAPDKSGYLLWQDFDNHPWGGNGPLLAFGLDPKDGDKSFNVETGVSVGGWQIASPVKNMDNLGNGVGTDAACGNAAYHRLFMPGWDSAELAKNDKTNYTGTVYLCGGMMKFGTGSSLGRLTLPAFTELSAPSSLLLTFNACPYYEPNGSTGSLETATDQADGIEFMVAVSGGGTIAEADDAAVNAESVKLKNRTAAEMQADTKGCYEWTGHTVKVSGATAETRIAIYTIAEKGGYRMWLDDIKVRKAQ